MDNSPTRQVTDYYDSIADTYDESRFANTYGRFIDSQERRVLDKLLGPASNRNVLEMACGTGRLTHYATHALDASENMMSHARERHPDVKFTHASATDTGLPDAMFDAIFSFHLLMHLDTGTIKQIFREAHRLLKPSGMLVVDIPSRKRRELLHHKQQSWHGATHLDAREMAQLAEGFELKSSHGIMLLPVHKLPKCVRKPLKSMDFALANCSFIKPYSSYLVHEFTKK